MPGMLADETQNYQTRTRWDRFPTFKHQPSQSMIQTPDSASTRRQCIGRPLSGCVDLVSREYVDMHLSTLRYRRWVSVVVFIVVALLWMRRNTKGRGWVKEKGRSGVFSIQSCPIHAVGDYCSIHQFNRVWNRKKLDLPNTQLFELQEH